MSIIEKLYNGEYYPSEQTLPSSEKYMEAKEEMHAAYDVLNDQLAKPQQQLLDDYAGKATDVHGYISLEASRLGVRFGLLVCELVCLLFHIRQTITSWVAAGVFSLYIGYDFQRAQAYPKTADNAVDCALDIYLDIINLFLRILRILGSRGSSSKNKF